MKKIHKKPVNRGPSLPRMASIPPSFASLIGTQTMRSRASVFEEFYRKESAAFKVVQILCKTSCQFEFLTFALDLVAFSFELDILRNSFLTTETAKGGRG